MTPNSVQLPLVIKNGLPYLEHYYPTDEKMDKITCEEWMTSKTTWDPSKLDDIEGASNLSISRFPPIPTDAIDSFCNSQGEIRATKSDLMKDPVVSDSPKDPVVSDSVKDPVDRDSTKDPVVNDSKKKPSWYRPKPTKDKKQKKGKWVNNKKVKWSDDTKTPSLPTHLLPPSVIHESKESQRQSKQNYRPILNEHKYKPPTTMVNMMMIMMITILPFK